MKRTVLMPILTLVLATLIGSFAVAAAGAPAVNDAAAFVGFSVINGQQLPVSAELRLLKFDTEKNSFLKRMTSSFAGQVDIQEEWLEAKQIISAEVAANIVSSCVDFGGKPETISVPAGIFNSCQIDTEDEDTIGHVWVAQVPFGVVRSVSDSKDGSVHSDLVLQSYFFGN